MHWRHSSPGVTRGHCAAWGTSISYENGKRPGEIDITLNTLDDPSGPSSRAHIWACDKQNGMAISDDLPVHARNIG